MTLWQSEDRHHRIPDELLDSPAVALESTLHLKEVPAHHGSEGLGREWLTRICARLGIREDQGDRLPALPRPDTDGEGGTAHAAKLETARVLFAAVRADPRPVRRPARTCGRLRF